MGFVLIRQIEEGDTKGGIIIPTWDGIRRYTGVSVPTIQARLKERGYTFEAGKILKKI